MAAKQAVKAGMAIDFMTEDVCGAHLQRALVFCVPMQRNLNWIFAAEKATIQSETNNWRHCKEQQQTAIA